MQPGTQHLSTKVVIYETPKAISTTKLHRLLGKVYRQSSDCRWKLCSLALAGDVTRPLGLCYQAFHLEGIGSAKAFLNLQAWKVKVKVMLTSHWKVNWWTFQRYQAGLLGFYTYMHMYFMEGLLPGIALGPDYTHDHKPFIGPAYDHCQNMHRPTCRHDGKLGGILLTSSLPATCWLQPSKSSKQAST